MVAANKSYSKSKRLASILMHKAASIATVLTNKSGCEILAQFELTCKFTPLKIIQLFCFQNFLLTVFSLYGFTQ